MTVLNHAPTQTRTRTGARTGAQPRTEAHPEARPRPRPQPRPRTRIRTASATLLAAALTVALAPGLAPAARAMGLPRTPPDRRLTVIYDDGAGYVRTYTVACGVPYDVGDGGPACEQLERIGGPVGPVPSGQACSMIYGGPQTARVTGMWDGRPVDETYRRTNGCEVARWHRMEPVLPSTRATHMRSLVG